MKIGHVRLYNLELISIFRRPSFSSPRFLGLFNNFCMTMTMRDRDVAHPSLALVIVFTLLLFTLYLFSCIKLNIIAKNIAVSRVLVSCINQFLTGFL